MKTSKTRKRLLIMLAVLMVMVGGCYSGRQSLLMWAYGIHQPRVESKESILQSAGKYGLKEHSIVSVAPDAYHPMLRRFYLSIPEGIIFNRAGQFINYKVGQADCNAGLFSFISQLDRHRNFSQTDSMTARAILQDLRDLDGNKLPATYLDKDADFYVMISWADYSGKLNKDHVAAWQARAEQNRQAKIQVVLVNFDIQSWWPPELRDSLLGTASI